MTDVMIRVPEHVRDRLAVLAEAQGTSIRALVQEFAESTLTPEERAERAAATRAYVATHFGVDVTEGDVAAIRAQLAAALGGGAAA
jgi:hypothetical protein